MFNSNKANIALSVILAIVLWFYVAGQVDPRTDKNINEVGIEYLGKEELQDNGLDFAGSSEDSVTVEIEGRRAALNRISPGDTRVTADLSNCTKGKNIITLRATSAKKVDIEKIDPQTITVIIEERVNHAKPVKVKFSGNPPKGREPGDVSLYPDNINVWGAESTVDRVKVVQVTVDVDKIKDEYTTVYARPVAVDAKGKKVKDVWLSSDSVEINAVMRYTKTVDFDVDVEGTVDKTMQLDKIEKPKKITIKSDKHTLSEISEVEGNNIDITGIGKTKNIPVDVILPYGVELANKSEDLSVKVVLKKLAEASFDFKTDEIIINGKNNNKVKLKDGTVAVTVKGSDKQMENLKKEDIKLTVNAGSIKDGKATVNYTINKKLNSVSLNPKVVEVGN